MTRANEAERHETVAQPIPTAARETWAVPLAIHPIGLAEALADALQREDVTAGYPTKSATTFAPKPPVRSITA